MTRGLVAVTPFQAVIFLCFSSTVLLGTALVSQYAFGLQPCPLCMMQRYPYFAVIVLSLLGMMVHKRPVLVRSILGVSGVMLICGAVIGGYQVGVEKGVFEGLSGCTERLPPNASMEEVKQALLAAASVSCKDPAIVVMGLSMAGWNAVVGSLLGVGAVVIAGRRKKHFYA